MSNKGKSPADQGSMPLPAAVSLAIYRYQRALDRPASDVELTRTKDAPSQSSINKEDVTV